MAKTSIYINRIYDRALVLWMCIGALDPYKCIDSDSLIMFEDYLCSLLWFSSCDLSMCICLWILLYTNLVVPICKFCDTLIIWLQSVVL